MNPVTLKSLFLDAIYQVLDNWVFRILAVMTLLPIAFVFLLGFREDHISFLFGVKTWSYEGLMAFFSGSGVHGLGDPQGLVVEALLQIIFNYVAGVGGVLFCIAATAFFIPRMIEKGAADVLFHKPVSRMVLYLSRYMAGLLFVTFIAVIMVTGVWLGLALVSGRNDPGVLCAIPALIYSFGLIHGVSMLIGVMTRSTVASILLTMLFFFGNGCVHGIWIQVEQVQAMKAQEESTAPAEEAEPGDPAEAEDFDEEESNREEMGMFLRSLEVLLNTLHYTLPKTSDVDFITSKLRRAVSPPLYKDKDTAFSIYREAEETDALALDELDPSSWPEDQREFFGELRFVSRGEFAEAPVTWALWRRPTRDQSYERNGRTRTRRENLSRAGNAFEELLETTGATILANETMQFGLDAQAVSTNASLFHWTGGTGGVEHSRALLLFRGTSTEGSFIYTLTVDVEAGPAEPEVIEELFGRQSSVSGFQSIMNQPGWYEEQLGFTAELKYNIFFSIGSSIAFTLVMLLFGWLKLRRIEF